MASTAKISAILSYIDADAEQNLQVVDIEEILGDTRYVKRRQLIGITPEALDISGLDTLGWAFFVNRSALHFIELLTGSGGDVFIEIPPLMSAGPFMFGSDVTAPFAQADTLACELEMLLIEAG